MSGQTSGGRGATIDELLAELTLEEKVALTAGEDMWHTPPVDRVGIPRFKMTDGPVGARGANNTGGPPSAAFPCGTALAATWDVDLVSRVAVELGAETVAKGAHVLLAPTTNLHRHPLAGRNFECYSEDPHLAARMSVAYVRGVQSQGVGACIKHLVANDSEHERFTISSEVPERAMRELYLRPFEVAVAEAEPWAIMASYNKIAGTWASENPWLLTTVLRDEWGWDGLVISDWFATHSTADAMAAGLDLEMPGPSANRGAALVDAVRDRDVDEADIDRSVRRLLVAMERTGALTRGPGEERADDTPERRAVAREAASSAVVLLRNEPVGGRAVLPLDPGALRSVAVLGPNADSLNILGGGSASVSPYHVTSALDGLRAVLEPEGVQVVHEPGCSITRFPPVVDLRWVTAPDGSPGIGVTIVEGDDPRAPGAAVLERHVTRRSALTFTRGVEGQQWAARMEATFRSPVGGRHVFQGGGSGRFRILLDGQVVVDGWDDGVGERRRLEGGVEVGAGHDHLLEVEFVPDTTAGAGPAGWNGLDLRCQAPLPDDAFDRAVRAAGDADVAVVVVGTNDDWETEGKDRRTMDLPGRQAELIRAVAEANERTVVLINAGAPVTMDWDGVVPAVAQSWFLGQETGGAIADVLTGAVDASGRLPTTFPRLLRDTPAFTSYPGEFGQVHYGEGLYVGYRWYDARGIEPAYPFGHGLSYTTFEWDGLEVVPADGGADVRLRVTNTGDRPGVETVQVYVHDTEGTVDRPPKELKAFTKVRLDPRTATDVTLHLEPDAFAHWSPAEHGWVVEPGTFEILAAASAGDVRLGARVTVP